MIRRQYTIVGKVQRVWFRASTREKALALGLCGDVGNLADGSVRVHAQGEAAAVDTLGQWLQRGPLLAKVTKIMVIDIELSPSESGFHIV